MHTINSLRSALLPAHKGQLGFMPVTIERASKLYDAAELPAMFTAMQQVFARATADSYQQAA
ncbi:hypothetical protein [Xanthomonas oryzae]|uniref:hypothetical protein n=1 Tax=Xanthomonas oryzae TaxID=347 RepID=UPI0035699B94